MEAAGHFGSAQYMCNRPPIFSRCRAGSRLSVLLLSLIVCSRRRIQSAGRGGSTTSLQKHPTPSCPQRAPCAFRRSMHPERRKASRSCALGGGGSSGGLRGWAGIGYFEDSGKGRGACVRTFEINKLIRK
jgi:hypothetical protein